jgi:hypothetical protein
MVCSEESTSNREVLAVRGREEHRNPKSRNKRKGRVKEDVQSLRTKISSLGLLEAKE